MKFNLGTNFVPTHRKVNPVELNADVFGGVLVNVIDVDFGARNIDGDEKRQPHHVVPVHVRLEYYKFPTIFRDSLKTCVGNACPHVDEAAGVRRRDLAASRVAAKEKRLVWLAFIEPGPKVANGAAAGGFRVCRETCDEVHKTLIRQSAG